MAGDYRPADFEARWQQRWADEGTCEVNNDGARPAFYPLSIYPYPRGKSDIEHVCNYTFGDLLVRYRTMNGFAVRSPVGFDSFGLPFENAAIVNAHGADALRLAIVQTKPPAEDVDWNDFHIAGCERFLGRVWRLAASTSEIRNRRSGQLGDADIELDKATHGLIRRVTDDFERWSYNTAIAAYMEFTNYLYRYIQRDDGPHDETLDFGVDTLLLLLAPTAPHMAAELWEIRSGSHIHSQAWPLPDKSKLVEDMVTMIVQVNGKLRDRIEVPAEISEDDALNLALGSEKVQGFLPGKPTRIVVRAPRLVNLVS
ncbi:MAG: class I tRNA ligase family protein [Acidimicrobiales bacterium]